MIKKIISILLLSFLLVSCNFNGTSSDNGLSSTSEKSSSVIYSSPSVDNKVYSYIDVTVLDAEKHYVCYDNVIASLDLSFFEIENIKVGQIYKVKVCLEIGIPDDYVIPYNFPESYDATLVSEPEYKEDEKMVFFVNRENYGAENIEKVKINLESVYFPIDTPIKNIIDEYDTKHSTKYTNILNKMYTSLEGKLLTDDISLYNYYLYSFDPLQ